MKKQYLFLILTGFGLLLTNCKKQNSSQESTILKRVPYYQVNLEDQFWLPRLKTQKETLVPFALDKTKKAVDYLESAANFLAGDSLSVPKPQRYQTSDLYKVMEGAALLLKENPDAELERQMDEIIDIISRAQQEDGYLYVAHITGASKDASHWGGGGMGDKPYSWLVHSHELYNMGHMYEAAIAYYQSTGKDRWLKIAEKNAQHINKVFFIGDSNYNDGIPVNQAPGHEEIELALVKLSEATNNKLYLEMAQKFLAIRGVTYIPEGDQYMSPTYAQQHKPVAQQRKATGHAVRAAYLYAAMADVDTQLQTDSYQTALESIWSDITDKKMHITGGLGAIHGIEGFGADYELPNKEAYNETCAAVGNVLFNYRMFLKTKDSKYLDVAEVSLYNNALAGVNLDGNKFFYVNPLETDGTTPFNFGANGRSPWFNTACCPSNLARLIPQIPGMMYAHTSKDIYTGLYASSSTEITLENGAVQLQQSSNYPFDGRIEISVEPKKSQQFKIHLRIPNWVDRQFVPGALYSYSDSSIKPWEVKINGTSISVDLEDGFAVIDRKWNPGDRLSLSFPMVVHFNQSIPEVTENTDKLAITKGPLVYCAEGIDNEDLNDLSMDLTSIKAETSIIDTGILKGIPQLSIQGKHLSYNPSNPKELKLIPYYSWNNRGDAPMRVWIPTNKK